VFLAASCLSFSAFWLPLVEQTPLAYTPGCPDILLPLRPKAKDTAKLELKSLKPEAKNKSFLP
jgi:hypothetical protein